MSYRIPNSQSYHRCKVSGPADLNHTVFTLNQEMSSPLWFSKEAVNDQKDNY